MENGTGLSMRKLIPLQSAGVVRRLLMKSGYVRIVLNRHH